MDILNEGFHSSKGKSKCMVNSVMIQVQIPFHTIPMYYTGKELKKGTSKGKPTPTTRSLMTGMTLYVLHCMIIIIILVCAK